MAERRMFAKTIIDSDALLDMPTSTQALYFHLSMRADDDGFLNNAKKIQRTIGCSDDDLKLLVAKKFIIPFQSGIVVIKHWRMHNYIQSDRYKQTVYRDEKSLLTVKKNGSYSLESTNLNDVSTLDTECIQDGYSLEAQVRLGKDSIGKDNILLSNSYAPKNKKTKKPKEEKPSYGYFNNVFLSDEELAKLKADFKDWEDRIERLSDYIQQYPSKGEKYSNHLATIRNWARRDKQEQPKQIEKIEW